jgi:hypothetical protein
MEQLMDETSLTVIYISGLSRIQQMFYFFEEHQTQLYSSLYVTKYIWETFDLPEDKTFDQVYREVCGIFSTFFKSSRIDHERNFDREEDLSSNRQMFLYKQFANHNVYIPQGTLKHGPERLKIQNVNPLQQTLKRPKNKTMMPNEEAKPTQLEIKYDENLYPLYDDEEPTEEPTLNDFVTEDMPQLIQDIKNAETLLVSEEIPTITSFEALFKLLQPNESINIKMNEDHSITFRKTIEA